MVILEYFYPKIYYIIYFNILDNFITVLYDYSKLN